MNNPLVSIIIPVFNKSDLVIETFKSIVNQSYANWECIVVDDGSSKYDFNQISEYTQLDQRFSLHKRPSDTQKGANACRNFGLSISKGRYIQFFDSDDLMLQDCLIGRVRAIQELSLDLVIFSMGIHKNDGFVNDDTPDVIVDDWEAALSAFIGKDRLPWNLQRTLYKSSLLKGEISFNEALSRFQDVEFNIRLLSRLKPKFKIFTEVDCVYRRASASNPRTPDFNQNVFNSIPVFLDSIYSEMPKGVLNENVLNLQMWLFNLIALYADKSIKTSQLDDLIRVSENKLELNSKQKQILRLLFISKTKLKGIKGVVRLNSYLRKKYIKLQIR
ncbi:glycosyltransferase family 2 protein [Hyunsoonleella flava]|uniref:Glycosyltransferase family 2 protein n=1 Tax=Hyunsoonleella flava TaxID=2527939 RepID=A0A4Q9FEF2_9FLAO|nr:glycosyltransferase family 2 protein [Hyunsoonleella flava]TBN03591.1 glycosyltransferase family 2 protein [Hyunsoonleella flava]